MTPTRTRRHMPWDTGRTDAVTAEAALLFEVVWPMFRKTVIAVAWWLARDPDDREELVHEAKLALWDADPGKYDLLNPDAEAYVRRILVNHMIDVFGRPSRNGAAEALAGRVVTTRDYEELAMQPAEIKAILAQFIAG